MRAPLLRKAGIPTADAVAEVDWVIWVVPGAEPVVARDGKVNVDGGAQKPDHPQFPKVPGHIGTEGKYDVRYPVGVPRGLAPLALYKEIEHRGYHRSVMADMFDAVPLPAGGGHIGT